MAKRLVSFKTLYKKQVIMKRFSILFLMFGLVLWSCREDSVIGEETDTTKPEPKVYYETNLIGQVVDEADVALAGATVSDGSVTVTTDSYGYFRLTSEAPSTGLHLKVTKEGYFVGGTQYFPNSDIESATTSITLVQKQYQTFSSDAAIMLTDREASLQIPAGALTLNGAPYIGEARIAARWLDPGSEDLTEVMPGALVGLNAAGEQFGLETFGMFAVEMEDMSGNELEIAEGQFAELNFPLSSSDLSAAPSEIPLWHFDETDGIWVEEGSAQKTNSGYLAKVGHFSWWNCDIPFDATGLCLTIVDSNNAPVNNTRICVVNPSGRTFCVESVSNVHCGLVNVDVILTLNIVDQCNNIVHTQDIGPYTGGFDDVTDEEIVVTLPTNYANLSITGDIHDCSGANVTAGAAILIHDGNKYVDLDLSNGTYDISFLVCDDNVTTVNTKAIDLVNLEEGIGSFELVAGTTTYIQDLSACGAQISPSVITIDSPQGDILLQESNAYQSKAETMIVATIDDNDIQGILLGFKGFGQGNFTGNLIPINGLDLQGPDNDGFADQVTVVVTEYGPVGGQIKGTLAYDNTTAVFVAERLR